MDWQGSQGQEGQAQLAYPLVIRFRRDLQHQEGVRPATGGMDLQKHSVGCSRGASSLTGTGSLWSFGWEMGEGDGTGERLCSPPTCILLSVAQQLSLLLSSSPPVVRADLLTYNLPYFKSRLLSEHTPSGPSAFASQTRGLCLAGGPPLCPSSLPPVRVVRTTSPPFLPSSVGLSSTLPPENPFCETSGDFLGYLGRCVWNLSDPQDAVSSASSCATIFPEAPSLWVFKNLAQDPSSFQFD